jgi:hypothetical protein
MGGDTEEIYGLRVCAPAPSPVSIRDLSTPIIIIQFITAIASSTRPEDQSQSGENTTKYTQF